MTEQNWKQRTYLIGSIVGALTGLGVALVIVRNAEKTGEPPQFGTSEGIRLGVLLLGLIRQVGKLGVSLDD